VIAEHEVRLALDGGELGEDHRVALAEGRRRLPAEVARVVHLAPQQQALRQPPGDLRGDGRGCAGGAVQRLPVGRLGVGRVVAGGQQVAARDEQAARVLRRQLAAQDVGREVRRLARLPAAQQRSGVDDEQVGRLVRLAGAEVVPGGPRARAESTGNARRR
jgi:hypothetical protein